MINVRGINCLTGRGEEYLIENGVIRRINPLKSASEDLPYVGPGLIDLQINGTHGVDFNDLSLTPPDLLDITHRLLSQGVTSFFPTLITNSDENLLYLLGTIQQACEAFPLVDACVGGIHLEGPFISKEGGARGAHPIEYVKAPDWDLFQHFQQASDNRIKLITLAPEWPEATEFIRRCRAKRIRVALGHTMADSEQIAAAVEAGAALSTHLGNAVPTVLPRHPNLLWDQLAQDELYASIIADGFHLPNNFIRVVMRVKPERTLLVSDATQFGGKLPGRYTTHIGGEVVLESRGRLAINDGSGLLAGAAKSLLENVQFLLDEQLVSPRRAWSMASVYPAQFLGKEVPLSAGQPADLVEFNLDQENIKLMRVMKRGEWVEI
ncbi:MAG: amidohydrolase family protein [Tunicatimonas sp.]|uniref:N-acetylglucosamine-6-phosphate deacetylase n=1 Tax=Tunicatimonas sp. TaxID=1940096 RepID=UPI003C77B2FE